VTASSVEFFFGDDDDAVLGPPGLKAGAVGFGLNVDALTFNFDDETEAVGLPGVVTVVPLGVLS